MISNQEKAKALNTVALALKEYLEDDFLAENQSCSLKVSCFTDLVFQYAGKQRGNKEALEAAIKAVSVMIPGLDAPDHRVLTEKSPE